MAMRFSFGSRASAASRASHCETAPSADWFSALMASPRLRKTCWTLGGAEEMAATASARAYSSWGWFARLKARFARDLASLISIWAPGVGSVLLAVSYEIWPRSERGS